MNLKEQKLKKLISEEIKKVLNEIGGAQGGNFIIQLTIEEYNDNKKINELKNYVNSLSNIRLAFRGRHTDRKSVYQQLGKQYEPGRQNDIPINQAQYISVYVRPKDTMMIDKKNFERDIKKIQLFAQKLFNKV